MAGVQSTADRAPPVDLNIAQPGSKAAVDYDGPIEIFGRVQNLEGNRVLIARKYYNDESEGTPVSFEANDREEGPFTEPVEVITRVPVTDAEGRQTGGMTDVREVVYMRPRVAADAGARKGIPHQDRYSLFGVTTTPQRICDDGNQDLPVVTDVIPPLTELGGGIIPLSPLFSPPTAYQRPPDAEKDDRQLDLLAGMVAAGPGSITARGGRGGLWQWKPATLIVRRDGKEVGSIKILALHNPKGAPVDGPQSDSIVQFQLNVEGDGNTTARTTRDNLDLLRAYLASATTETLGKPREVTVRDGW